MTLTYNAHNLWHAYAIHALLHRSVAVAGLSKLQCNAFPLPP